jgi:hypothetical protein
LIYLTGSANPTLREVANKERFGLLLQPATRYRNIIPEFPVWAADNGCFTQPKKFRVDKYLAWLDAHRPYVHTCLFATAPDIVGDAKATWERSAPVLPEIRALGYKAALVGQNGLETMKIEWDEFDVFFVGDHGGSSAREVGSHGPGELIQAITRRGEPWLSVRRRHVSPIRLPRWQQSRRRQTPRGVDQQTRSGTPTGVDL